MTNTGRILIAPLLFATALSVVACSSNEGDAPAETTPVVDAPSAVPAAASTALTKEQVSISIAQVGATTFTAEDKSLNFVVKVTNNGTVALPAAGAMPVQLGVIQLVPGTDGLPEKRGKDSRVTFPQDLQPAASIDLNVKVPADFVVGNKVQFEPVQEGVAWFGFNFEQPVLVLGPFKACGADPNGVCDATGNPVTATAPAKP